MSEAEVQARHALSMKYEYARLALSSPARFRSTFDTDPRFFADLWRARALAAGLDTDAVPSLAVHGDVMLLSFPECAAPQACLYLAVWISSDRARVFALERARPIREQPTTMLIEIAAGCRTNLGPHRLLTGEELVDRVRAVVLGGTIETA